MITKPISVNFVSICQSAIQSITFDMSRFVNNWFRSKSAIKSKKSKSLDVVDEKNDQSLLG